VSVYLIGSFEVTDPELYADYARQAPATVAAHGGEYLARGGATELLEGEPHGKRQVIIRFPSMAAARAWYNSPEYVPLRALRNRAAHGPLLFTVGTDEPAP